MSYTLSKAEKETTILYNQTQEPMIISTCDPALRHRLAIFARQHPCLCKRIDKRHYSDYAEFEIEKSRVSVRLIAPYSDERRQAASELARQKGLGSQTAKE